MEALLILSANVAKRIVKDHELSCSIMGSHVTLWGWVIAPAENFWGELQGSPVVDSTGVILDLPLGLTRETIEEYLTMGGVEQAVYRALAVKAGIPVNVADWFWWNEPSI